MHALNYIFSASEQFFPYFFNLKKIISTPKFCSQSTGDQARFSENNCISLLSVALRKSRDVVYVHALV